MKNDIFWDVTPCGSCKNRRLEEFGASFFRVTTIGELGTTLTVTISQTYGTTNSLAYCMLRTETNKRGWNVCICLAGQDVRSCHIWETNMQLSLYIKWNFTTKLRQNREYICTTMATTISRDFTPSIFRLLCRLTYGGKTFRRNDSELPGYIAHLRKRLSSHLLESWTLSMHRISRN
jgi:hypothetical protein